MKKKNLLIVGIVLLVVLSLYSSFVQGDEFSFGEQGTIKYSEGVDVNPTSEGGALIKLNQDILESGDYSVEINGNKFENIHRGTIEVKSNGDLDSATFFTNEKGGEYNFNGNTIKVPPNSKVHYSEEIGFALGKGSKLLSFNSEQPLEIYGEDINLFDEIIFDGWCFIDRKGILIGNGNVNYKQMNLEIDGSSGDVLIANPDADLSNYRGNWIKQTSKYLEIKSYEKEAINIEFLENNEILNTGENKKLKLRVSGGDGIIFEKRIDKPLLATHRSSKNGKTLISMGGVRNIFLEKDNIFLRVSKNTGLPIPMKIQSDSENINSFLRINDKGELFVFKKGQRPRLILNKKSAKVGAGFKKPKTIGKEPWRDMPLLERLSRETIAQSCHPYSYPSDIDELCDKFTKGKDQLPYSKEKLDENFGNVGGEWGKVDEEDLLYTPGRVDFFRKYLGLPQYYNTIVESDYKPPKSKLVEGATYYDYSPKLKRAIIENALKVNPTLNFAAFLQRINESSFEERETDSRGIFPNIGTFQGMIGYDSERKEKYISYRDYWDLDPEILKKRGIDIDKFNYPFHFYGRVYKSEFEKIKRGTMVEELK